MRVIEYLGAVLVCAIVAAGIAIGARELINSAFAQGTAQLEQAARS